MGAQKLLPLLIISLLVMTHLVECKRRSSESRHRSNGRTSHSSSHGSHSHSSPSHSSHSHSSPSHSSSWHSSPYLHSSSSHSTLHSGSRSRVNSHSTLNSNSHHDSPSSNDSGHNTPRRGYITTFHEAEASQSTRHSMGDDEKPKRHESTTPKSHKPTDAPASAYYDSPNSNNNNRHSGSGTSHAGPTTPSVIQELGHRIRNRLRSDRAKYATSTTKRPVNTTTPTYEETMPYQASATGPGFDPTPPLASISGTQSATTVVASTPIVASAEPTQQPKIDLHQM